jgi:hypothetical protein
LLAFLLAQFYLAIPRIFRRNRNYLNAKGNDGIPVKARSRWKMTRLRFVALQTVLKNQSRTGVPPGYSQSRPTFCKQALKPVYVLPPKPQNWSFQPGASREKFSGS